MSPKDAGPRSVFDWTECEETHQVWWWRCGVCKGRGKENPSRQRAERLLARHLVQTHGCPTLPREKAKDPA